MLAALLEWLCANSPESLPSGVCSESEPEPPVPAADDERSPEETLAFWQAPGRIEAVNGQWACLVGSYHHTCTTWVNGAGDQVTCAQPGCDPTI